MIKSKKIFLLSIFALLINNNILFAQSVKLSEIMFAPSESNSEFIEVKNTSENETIDLTGYKIKYHTVSADDIISPTNEYLLQPNQYAIIFEADYDFGNGVYQNILDANALIFILDDNAFGSTGMANTSDREIFLLNSTEDTIDSYIYSADNEIGFSDEIIDFDKKNWSNSTILNGTPGSRNSVSPKQNDLRISEIKFSSSNIVIGEAAAIKITIENLGVLLADQFIFNLYNDVNKDKIQLEDELIFTKVLENLLPNDFVIIEDTIRNIELGENNIIAEVIFDQDEFLENNYAFANINGIEVNEIRGDLVINEIMYAPESPEPEWIEIFNKSNKNILFDKYKVADKTDTIEIISQPMVLKSNEYLVISDDSLMTEVYPNLQNIIISKLPTLNNSDDEISIMDSLFRVIDSLAYNSSWGGKNGKSLERIDPYQNSNDELNWSESKFPTPGKLNSISKKDYDVSLDTVFISPNDAVISDSINIFAKIKNIGKKEFNFSLQLFDDLSNDFIEDNLIEQTKLISINSDDSLNIEFSTKIKVEEFSKNYLIKITQDDDDRTNNYKWLTIQPGYPKKSIIINEIMFSPINDEPEWIEIFNNSNFVINLNNWEVGDVLTNPVFTKITNEDIFIEPNSYLVIAKDETIFNYHKMILSQTIFTKFANLNNDSDGIVIKDNREITIDSVLYESNWGTRGNSIERKNKSFSSSNKNNWGTSIDIEGSTPGRVNSISPKNIDIAAIAINTIPKNPVKNDFVTIQLKLKNYGEQNSESVKIKFYYGNKVPDNLLEEIDINSINKGDTLNIITTKKIKIEDTLIIAAQIQTQNDEDIINNYIEKSIIAGFNLHTLLINEIMFKTENDAPEWIELYNNADSTINLKGWQISNGNLTSIITEENIFIEPNDFIVLSDLTNKNYFEKEEVKVIYTELPELNDRKDDVIIYDYRNAVIDSINYEVSNYMIPNISLERISLSSESSDQLNWTFSLSSFGSTPGNENSVKTLPSNNFGDLIFTEIMFNPNENNSEYLEIYNTGENPIEIGGWKVMVGEVIFTLSDFSYMLNSQSYFTLSADSSIYDNYEWLKDSDKIKIVNASSLGLTNTGKAIYLIDYKNEIIDSLNYSEAWHNSAFEETKNISLELINVNLDRTRSSNWSSSVSSFGGSPGKQNSIYVDKSISQTKLSISPNPFSPDNDGFEDFTIISYNLKEAISQIRIRIFDSKGRMVRTLANNIPSGSQGEIIFDGLDTLGNPLRIGIYIILFEAINPNNAVVEVLKEVVVVARKL